MVRMCREKVKKQVTLEQAMKTQRGTRGIVLLFHQHRLSSSLTSALDGVGGQLHASAALPPEKTWHPLYRRLGGPQGRSGQGRKISPSPGFDTRTVHPVASRYAIPIPICVEYRSQFPVKPHSSPKWLQVYFMVQVSQYSAIIVLILILNVLSRFGHGFTASTQDISIQFIQFHQIRCKSKSPIGYRISRNTLYQTL